jgi:DNA-binding IclR family transcriptional regulator
MPKKTRVAVAAPKRTRAKGRGVPSKKKKPRDVPESSLERMIGLLDLFQGETRAWTVDQMHQHLGYTRSTLYRYLKVLSDVELLTSLPDVGYVLGPRVIELDFLIRRQDPLVVASVPVMAELISDIPSIALLCRRYRDKVLCIHQIAHPSIAIHSTYERGKPLPLFSGAASRIILANMSRQHINRLYAEQAQEFAKSQLGGNLTDIRRTLQDIRLRGWDHTTGQVTAGITGVAAPIFDGNKNVLGSLSLSLHETHITPQRLSSIAERVVFCSRVISHALIQERGRQTSDR